MSSCTDAEFGHLSLVLAATSLEIVVIYVGELESHISRCYNANSASKFYDNNSDRVHLK